MKLLKHTPHISFLLLLSSIIWKRYAQPRRNKKLRCSEPWTSGMPAIWLTLYHSIGMYIWISKYMLTIYRLVHPSRVSCPRKSQQNHYWSRAGRAFPLVYLEVSVVGPKNLLGSVRFPRNGQEQFHLLKISTNLWNNPIRNYSRALFLMRNRTSPYKMRCGFL
jgi:hypothetical protein